MFYTIFNVTLDNLVLANFLKLMLPKKLKDDSIVEAVCLLQFETNDAPEIIIGRLSDAPLWKGYSLNRLPMADIPAPVRKADDNLRNAPLLQLRSSDGERLVQIGENVISFHIIGKYCGWIEYESKLKEVIDFLFSKFDGILIKRIGLRYINALSFNRHYVEGAHSLNIDITAAGDPIDKDFNLNFIKKESESHFTLTRIASPEFVKGNMPEDVTVAIDVDVHTPIVFEITQKEDVINWIYQAHEFEKKAFFKLLPQEIIFRLKEA
ncbi:MAG: TIGR04255 family protein [Methylococcaceae bacterium]